MMNIKKKIYKFGILIIILASFCLINPSHTNAQAVSCSNVGDSCCPSDATIGHPSPYCNNSLACVNNMCSQVTSSTSCDNVGDSCCLNKIDGSFTCNNYLLCGPANTCIKAPVIAPGPSAITCSNGAGVNTAIGCIPINDSNALVGFFLKWGIGIGGGIAFLLILVAGFQIMTSRGDPNQLKAGQELLTSAIAGLLLLIFSLVILRIIGFDILGIGAFNG